VASNGHCKWRKERAGMWVQERTVRHTDVQLMCHAPWDGSCPAARLLRHSLGTVVWLVTDGNDQQSGPHFSPMVMQMLHADPHNPSTFMRVAICSL
jgi:hypothetical protein